MNGLNRTIRQWKKKQQTKLWPATVSYCGLWSEDFHGFLFDNPYLDDGRVAKQFFWCLWKRKSFCHPDKLGWQHNYNQTCQIKFFPQLREVWGKFFIDPVTPSRVNNYKRLFFSGILIHDTKGWYGPFGSPKSYLILQLFGLRSLICPRGCRRLNEWSEISSNAQNTSCNLKNIFGRWARIKNIEQKLCSILILEVEARYCCETVRLLPAWKITKCLLEMW